MSNTTTTAIQWLDIIAFTETPYNGFKRLKPLWYNVTLIDATNARYYQRKRSAIIKDDEIVANRIYNAHYAPIKIKRINPALWLYRKYSPIKRTKKTVKKVIVHNKKSMYFDYLAAHEARLKRLERNTYKTIAEKNVRLQRLTKNKTLFIKGYHAPSKKVIDVTVDINAKPINALQYVEKVTMPFLPVNKNKYTHYKKALKKRLINRLLLPSNKTADKLIYGHYYFYRSKINRLLKRFTLSKAKRIVRAIKAQSILIVRDINQGVDTLLDSLHYYVKKSDNSRHYHDHLYVKRDEYNFYHEGLKELLVVMQVIKEDNSPLAIVKNVKFHNELKKRIYELKGENIETDKLSLSDIRLNANKALKQTKLICNGVEYTSIPHEGLIAMLGDAKLSSLNRLYKLKINQLRNGFTLNDQEIFCYQDLTDSKKYLLSNRPLYGDADKRYGSYSYSKDKGTAAEQFKKFSVARA